MTNNKKTLVQGLNKTSPIELTNKDQLKKQAMLVAKPIIGITYLEYNGSFGLDNLYKAQRGDKNILKDFGGFLSKARSFNNIQDMVSAFISHNCGKNKDPRSVQKMKQIQKDFNIETTDMIHLHCCVGGKGRMLLHGFILENCFEIVWIDPSHDLYK